MHAQEYPQIRAPMLLAASLLALELAVVPSTPPSAVADTIPLGTTWTMHSALLGETRSIRVHLPRSYGTARQHYPVLFVLDGEQIFLPASGVAEALVWGFRAPEVIVVGIDNVQRSRDMLTRWTSPAPKGMYEGTAARAGGADRFLAFIRDELIPEIDRRYRTTPYRILFGHSAAGFFALHAFASAPSLFASVIASSPAAFWNGDEVTDQIATDFARTPGLDGTLFITAAAKEFDDTPRAVNKLDEMLTLRAPHALRWSVVTIPGTDHGTSLLTAMQRGLEFTFTGWRLPTFVFDQGLEAIEQYYRGQSARYGFPIAIPTGELSALGARQRATNPATAVVTYRRFRQLYPTSMDAAVGLAESLLEAKDSASARAAFADAITLGRAAGDTRVQALQARLDSLSGRQKGSGP